MSRWFRHYAGMMRDEKLVRIAIKTGQPIERVLWVWGAILESAAEIDDDGKFDLDTAEIAYFLRADEGDISGIFAALSALGRIAGGVVVKWGDRQFKSDKSKERVAAFRQRKRSENVHSDDELEGCNVTPSLPKRKCNGPETETETETEKKPPKSPKGELPDWIPASDWSDFVAMRKAIRKPMTAQARKLAINELARLRDAGNDPAKVLQQSTLNSWQGVFPLKQRAGPAPAVGI